MLVGDGNVATSAYLYLPTGVALDTLGNIYIADSGNNRIRKVSVDYNSVIQTVAPQHAHLPAQCQLQLYWRVHRG